MSELELDPEPAPELEFDHVTYIVDRLHGEIGNQRLWFIAQRKPQNDYEFEALRKLSRFLYWKKRTGCSYSAQIEKQLGDS